MSLSYNSEIHQKFCDALISVGIEPDQDLLLIIADLVWLVNQTMFKVEKLERKVEELEADNGKSN